MRNKTPTLKQRRTLLIETINNSKGLSKELITNYTKQLKEVSMQLDKQSNKLNLIKEQGGLSIL